MSQAQWKIDPLHSAIGFSVRHMVISKVKGRFSKWSAELTLDEDVTRSNVTVKIDAGSIDTGVEQRDNHLRSTDFFDTATFPELVFQSRKVERAGSDHLKVTGDLTIRDVTREVVLEVETTGEARDPWGNVRAGFLGKTSIDRKAFGLGWNQILEAGGLLVGDRVDIELEIEAVRQAEARKAA
jgi:polyisoprenoid-binding protein YceI